MKDQQQSKPPSDPIDVVIMLSHCMEVYGPKNGSVNRAFDLIHRPDGLGLK